MTYKLPLRAALIGCGGRGRAHLDTLHASADVDFVAVCDPDDALISLVHDKYGIASGYHTVEALLEKETIDLAIVAAPAHLNAQVALPLLDRGINTLLEKPPGLSSQETRSLKAGADRTGAKCLVGWNRRFHPLLVNAREMIEARGPVVQICAEFHKSMSRLDTGRWPDSVMDNMLLETPIHALDMCRAIAGSEVRQVYAVERRSLARFVDVHAALIVFENGCVAQFSANYTTDARLERYEIHGNGISAYLEGVKEGVVVSDGDSMKLHGADSGGGTREQNQYFVECIKNDLPVRLPAADLNEAIKTMELAERVRDGLID